nr:unnamed protein product [Callosobruchus analis]
MSSSRKTSEFWNHFEEVEGGKKAKCSYCRQIISVSQGSTGNLSRHLRTKHTGVQIKRDNLVKKRPASSSSGSESSVMKKDLGNNTIATNEPMQDVEAAASATTPLVKQKSTTLSALGSLDAFVVNSRPIGIHKSKQFDKQLIKMIVKEYHPLSIVEDKEFKAFVNMLSPGYKLPSRKTISSSLIPQLYECTRENVKLRIRNSLAISITTDSWTSIANQNFVGITAHWINEGKMESHLLECVEFSDRHTASNLTNLLQKVFSEWEITGKICCVVTDNAHNIVAAVNNGNWRHVSCFAHSLNLIVQSGLTRIEPVLNKVRKIVEHFRRSPHALAKLNQVQEQMNLPILKLKIDVCTRWNSTWDMIRRFSERKDPIISAMALLQYNEWILTSEDWDTLKICVDVLKIFDDVTQEISAEKTVTLSKVFIFINGMKKHLSKYLENGRNNSVEGMINIFLEKIAERFRNFDKNELICQAILLDPRFKKLGFTSDSKFVWALESLKKKVTSTHVTEKNVEEERVDTEDYKNKQTTSTLWEDFDATVAKVKGGTNPLAAGIVEVDKYMNEPLVGRNENPLIWWEQRKAIYPRLYILAIRRLCITATSVPCERIFSKTGQIATDRRSRLKSSKLSQIIFLNFNL